MANKTTSESIFQKRIRNFKKIRRAYYSLIIIVVLYLISFFAPLLINNKALMVKYNNETYFPAFADLFSYFYAPTFKEAKHFGQNEVFGVEQHGEPNYRELKKQFQNEAKGNFVIMPPYTYSPVENLLGEMEKGVSPPTKPDAKHIFGTDNRGRDVFARIIYGFNISLSFALIVSFFSYLIAILVGAFLAYYGGKIDLFGMRFIEIFSELPTFLLIMMLVSFMKPSFMLLAAILVVLGGWIGATYLIRGEFYREKARDYTASAVAMGASDFYIMFKEILPNALTPIIANAPFAIIGGISSLVSLDYLGFGLPPPTPSWGELIGQGTSEDIRNWWLILTPIFMLFFTLITITFIGEGVRQAFDPREYSRLE